MKKMLSMVAILLIAAVALYAGGAGDSQSASEVTSDGVVELNMYHSWSTDTQRGAALNELIAQFNAENEDEISISVDINPDFPAYQEKVKAMIAADNTPDIFHYNFNPNDLSRQRSGKLLDFTEYMDAEWKARFNEGDLQALTVDGKLTSVPFEKAGALMYYNTKLFSEVGYDEFPKTWDELFAAFDELMAIGIYPISLYTADDAWHTTNLLSYLSASAGGSAYFNGGGDVDTPAMVKGAEYLQKAFGYTTGDAIGANYSISVNNLSTEKTAMVIDGPWLIGMIEPAIKDYVAIAPAPTFGDGTITPGFTVTDAQTPWAAAAQADPRREEAIVTFMKYITNSKSTKELTLNGSVFLSAKLEIEPSDLEGIDPLMVQYIQVNSASRESIVNIQRNLKPAANAQIPSLMESLALDMITPQQFIDTLAQENK